MGVETLLSSLPECSFIEPTSEILFKCIHMLIFTSSILLEGRGGRLQR